MMKIVIDAPTLAAGVGATGVTRPSWSGPGDICAQSVINLSTERTTDWQTLHADQKAEK